MSKVAEFFGRPSEAAGVDWRAVLNDQTCPFLGRKCYKTRKGNKEISIGTCTVKFGSGQQPIMICPTRMLQNRQIFTDCLHLLTNHQPGNELHLVPEVQIPGGNVDFFIVSVGRGRITDFVGVELQTLDTTGSVWPERQRLLRELGLPRDDAGEDLETSYGMNWKMTAKTILVQMHHKIQTFEHLNKKLVLVIQDHLLSYMAGEFNFSHMNQAHQGDPMQLHAYSLQGDTASGYRMSLANRLSTDTAGIASCLGLQAEARVEYEQIIAVLARKISPATLFAPLSRW